jgi:hypothetical protein
MRSRRLGCPHNHVFQLFQTFAAGFRHVISFHCAPDTSPASHTTNAPRANLLRHFERICLNLLPSLRYLPPPNRLNHEDANRPVVA